MRLAQRLGLTAGLVSLASLTAVWQAAAAERGDLVQLAQFQPKGGDAGLSEEEKARRRKAAEEQKKGPPPKGPPPQAAPPKGPPPPPKGPPPPPPKAAPQFEKRVAPPPPPPPPPKAAPQFEKRVAPPPPPPGPKAYEKAPAKEGFSKEPSPPDKGFKKVAPKDAGPDGSPKGPPAKGPQFSSPDAPKGPPSIQKGPGFTPGAKGPVGIQKGPGVTAAPAPRFDQVQQGRRERVEDNGKRRIIVEPGNRTIIRQDNRILIRHDETDRFRRGGRDVREERRPDGTRESFFIRPDGARVVTVLDANGRLLRRYRRGPDGREFNLIDNRRFYRNAALIGVGAVGVAVLLNLRRPSIGIPSERYIVDYDRASDDDLYDTLMADPVDRLDRAYSLEEIRENVELRDYMPRVDLAINFEFGSFEVGPDQAPQLERIARVINRVLERSPDEVFMIEGHTDAVGSDIDNLSLSDRRAQAVAEILSDEFGVPAENLVTQGFGKQFLKIDTPEPERANRRVAIRRIKPLMSDR